LILFIRKKDAPYYTVELDVEKMKVIQNRGFQNKGVNNEVKKFMNKWAVKKLMRVTNVKSKAI